MDPRFLEDDELQVELNIRGLDKKEVRAIEILSTIIEEEIAGLRPVAIQVHSDVKTIVGECSAIQSKLSSIRIQSGEQDELNKCRSRLYHLLGRVNRISNKSGSHAQVSRLKAEIELGLETCNAWITGQLVERPAEVVRDSLEEAAQRQFRALTEVAHADQASSSSFEPVHHSPKNQLLQPNQPSSVDEITIEEDNPEASNLPIDANQSPSSIQNQHVHLYPEEVMANMNWQNAQLSPNSNQGNEPNHNASAMRRQERIVQTRDSTYHGFVPPPAAGNAFHPQRAPHPNSHCAQSAHLENHRDRFGQQGSFVGFDRHQGNTSQWWAMSKWPIRFAGTSRDLPVDEFIFRVETLARLGNIPQPALALGLHQLLGGAVADWYWIYIRNEPNATWLQVKNSLIFAFQSNVSDDAIRRLIMYRLQRPGERFMEFCVALQGLEVRLANRMSEFELLNTMKRNMLPHLQDRILFFPVNSILQLQQRVRQIEELMQRQSEVHNMRRSDLKIHELSVPPPAYVAGHTEPTRHSIFSSDESLVNMLNGQAGAFNISSNENQNPFSSLPPGYSIVGPPPQPQGQFDYVNAISPADRNNLTICWNCDDIGHSYTDCQKPRCIFCYSCGTKGFIKGNCPTCSVRLLQGNAPRNARLAGSLGVERPPGHHQAFRPPR